MSSSVAGTIDKRVNTSMSVHLLGQPAKNYINLIQCWACNTELENDRMEKPFKGRRYAYKLL